MRLDEAYKILDLPQSASADEVKQRYREYAKKYHPDINKEINANDKFKEINNAYERINKGGQDQDQFGDNFDMSSSGFPFPFGSPFGSPFNRTPNRNVDTSNVSISTNISFKDSVFGCKKDVEFNRRGKCQNCDGNGVFKIHNGCDQCNGQGHIMSRNGNMIFTTICNKCGGRAQTQSCNSCGGSGTTDNTISVTVTIPGGIHDKNVLRLGGIGNFFAKNMMGTDQYTDVLLRVDVEQIPGLELIDNDVVSTQTISLLDALVGINDVPISTVDGLFTISIPPKSKNKDEVVIPNLGVNKVGNHRVILNVEYPGDLSDLIYVLQESKCQ